ncbi:B1 bradykinin receptor [Channa argus]
MRNIFRENVPMDPVQFASVAVLSIQNSNESLAFSPSESPVSTDWDLLHIVIPPFIFILSLLGLLFNSFVLGVFVVHKDRITVAEVYLSNLALGDFFLMCGLPFWAMYILNDFNWTYGDALCKIVNSIIIINYYTSIYTLVMISIDRYLALVKTMKARWLRRTLYAKVMCLILWILGLLLSTPIMVYRQVRYMEEYETTSCILNYSYSWKVAHQILINVAGFVLPIMVIVFSSGNIIKALAQRRESVGFQDTKDTKATVLVYAVTLLFLLCWGPFHVFTFLDTLCTVQALDEKLWSHTLNIGDQLSVYLAFLNSVLNPLLYVSSGQYFRRKVTAIYRRTRYQNRRRSDLTTYQRSVVSSVVTNRTELITDVVIFNAEDQM